MENIANSKNVDSRFKKIADLKTQASVLVFLQNNNITDMENLVDNVTKMNEEFYEVSTKSRPPTSVWERLHNIWRNMKTQGFPCEDPHVVRKFFHGAII